MVAAVFITAVAGVLYRCLDSNITSVAIPAAVRGSTAMVGLPAGQPVTLAIIGTDARQTTQDCALGGDCGGGGANADVEMLVHISADHSSMSVVSIPRDTIVQLPACNDHGAIQTPHLGRINSSLAYGTGCMLQTLHQVTGLPLDHFATVDFEGVVNLSNAIGGVNVCVDNNVYDPYSHLKLTRGSHRLQGLAALEFVRTRHGFGDGSDLGRTVAQHLFLSSLQRQLESNRTLWNPVRVYNIAQAGVKALTVDPGLGSVMLLSRAAFTIGQIPASHTSFVTLPTTPNPDNPNTVILAASAQPMLDRLLHDQPLTVTTTHSTTGQSTATAATPTSTAPSSTQDPASSGKVQVSSQITGCAHVSTQDTVAIDGQPMSPVQAFADSPRVPLSAP